MILRWGALVILLVLTVFMTFTGIAAAAYTLEKMGTTEIDISPDNKAFEQAFEDRSQKVILSVSGRVIKTLEEPSGSKYQKFLVDIDGRTVLVAHNLEMGRMIPVEPNYEIVIKGEYIWTEKGGVIHWTHRDPRKEHPDGFIYYNKRLYK